ncbi:MAG: aminopeptidase [Planctomycetota bacterium]
MCRAIVGFWGLLFVLPLAGGCGADFSYILPVIAGQTTILFHSVPIAEALNGGTLSAEEKAKLVLIREVRAYAGREMGLDTADHYALFYDAGEGGLAYNVSAALRYEFHAKQWEFPIVGVLPYIGFFDEGAARREFEDLKAQGYDAFLYEVDAYSTLDYLPNPILSPMLRRDDLDLMDTVMHELLHSTVWHPTDTTFNESLATFVGRAGALEYLAARYSDEPERIQAAVEHYEDVDLYNAFIFELYDELDAFYSSGLSQEERIAGREAYYQAGRERFVAEVLPLLHDPDGFAWVADLPTNNAWMLANVRYNYDLDVYAQVHEATGRVWKDTLAVFSDAAREDAPNVYLREWLGSP